MLHGIIGIMFHIYGSRLLLLLTFKTIYPMRFTMTLCLLLISSYSFAQFASEEPWRQNRFRAGLTIQAGAAYWNQQHINQVLKQHNSPTPHKLSALAGFGTVVQWSRYRLDLTALYGSDQHTENGKLLEQRTEGAELNMGYLVHRSRKIALSPQLGLGIMNAVLKVRDRAEPQSLSGVFVNRNVTELYNRQGYVHAGLSLDFGFLPGLQAQLFQLSAGYRFGFLDTDWSTDPYAQVLSQSVSDPLRQAYLSLKVNYWYRGSRR